MKFLPTELIFNIVILGLLFIILLGFSALLAAIYKFLTDWLNFLHQEKVAGADEIREDAHKKAQSILSSANKEAVQLIADVNKEAMEILEEMGDISEESKAKLSETFSNTSDNLLKIYESNIQEQKDESLRTLAGLTENIDKNLKQEFDEFEQFLRDETIDSEDKVKNELMKRYEKLDKELKEYRAKKVDELEASLYDILYDVSQKVLGKGLSMDEHQQLILESLEEAKSRKLFSSD